MPTHLPTRTASVRIFVAVAVVAPLLVALLANSGVPKAAAAPKCTSFQTLRTGENPAAAYAPPQVVAAQGFLKQACVTLQEQPVAGAAALVAQLEAGRADMALLNPAGIIQAVQSGIKLRIVAPNSGPGDFGLCVPKNSPIKTLKDFAGKTISTTLLGSNTDIAVRILLERAGVDLDKVKFVQIPNATNVQSIANGVVDGGQCQEPDQTRFASQLRVIDQVPMADAFGKNTPETYAITTAADYNAHKTLFAHYQQAYLRAAALVARRPQVFRNAVHNFTGTPTNITNRMHLATMPNNYAFNQLVEQVKALVAFKSIQSPISNAQLKSLFVPLAGVKGGGLN